MNTFTRLALVVSLSLMPLLGAASDTASRPSCLIEAVKVAMDDFEKRLADEPKDWDYAAYVSNIRKYGIGFAESDDYYVVVFQLKAMKERILGSGGKYLVGKRNMKIIKFVGNE